MLVVGAGCNGQPPTGPVEVDAAAILLEMPSRLGVSQRKPVLFDHQAHVKAVGEQACTKCHPLDDQKRVVPRLAGLPATDDADVWMQFFHDTCIGCHQERKDTDQDTGPVTCGQCHLERKPLRQVRAPMHFDYALHAMHVKAADDRCDACHHVYDEGGKKLVYRKGEESACSDCHLDEPGGPTGNAPSLREASHLDCIGCHREQAGETGKKLPITCTGCHDPKAQAAIDRPPIDGLPRLERGQPDIVWIRAEGATSNLVAFNHAFHETVTTACSDCHHKTLQACSVCHTLVPAEPGGFVSLKQAYHLPTSKHSCVGCHEIQTGRQSCAGCHHELGPPPAEGGCTACHAGPPPAQADEVDPASILTRREPQPLPATSDDFPDTIMIDAVSNKLGVTEGDDYGPAHFPHRAIVERLHRDVAGSRLALRYHRGSQTLCAGCHHRTPPGSRPSACGSCHVDRPGRTTDMPGLMTAYHRQCIGCHEQMKLGKQGCTDCHDAVGKEGQR